MSVRGDYFRSRYFDSSPRGWLVEIDEYYLQSSVSYYGLSSVVPHCSRVTSIIKGRNVDVSEMTHEQVEKLAANCRLLYGLLHQRYVITEEGVRKLYQKYQRGVYGTCPRVACRHSKLLPMGLSQDIGHSKVKLWCPKCHDIYDSPQDIDGAYFGPDLPIMFHKISDIPLKFKAFSDLLQESERENIPAIKQRLYRWGESPQVK